MISLGLRVPFLPFIERPNCLYKITLSGCCVFLPSPSCGFLTSNLSCLHFLSHCLHLFSLLCQHLSLSSSVIFLPNPRAVFFQLFILNIFVMMHWSSLFFHFCCHGNFWIVLWFSTCSLHGIRQVTSPFWAWISSSGKWPLMCQSLVKPLYKWV